MRICMAHKREAVRFLKDSFDGAEYDLCKECYEEILPILTGQGEQRTSNIAKPKPRTVKK